MGDRRIIFVLIVALVFVLYAFNLYRRETETLGPFRRIADAIPITKDMGLKKAKVKPTRQEYYNDLTRAWFAFNKGLKEKAGMRDRFLSKRSNLLTMLQSKNQELAEKSYYSFRDFLERQANFLPDDTPIDQAGVILSQELIKPNLLSKESEYEKWQNTIVELINERGIASQDQSIKFNFLLNEIKIIVFQKEYWPKICATAAEEIGMKEINPSSCVAQKYQGLKNEIKILAKENKRQSKQDFKDFISYIEKLDYERLLLVSNSDKTEENLQQNEKVMQFYLNEMVRKEQDVTEGDILKLLRLYSQLKQGQKRLVKNLNKSQKIFYEKNNLFFNHMGDLLNRLKRYPETPIESLAEYYESVKVQWIKALKEQEKNERVLQNLVKEVLSANYQFIVETSKMVGVDIEEWTKKRK